jgi:hypothetical protein
MHKLKTAIHPPFCDESAQANACSDTGAAAEIGLATEIKLSEFSLIAAASDYAQCQ